MNTKKLDSNLKNSSSFSDEIDREEEERRKIEARWGKDYEKEGDRSRRSDDDGRDQGNLHENEIGEMEGRWEKDYEHEEKYDNEYANKRSKK